MREPAETDCLNVLRWYDAVLGPVRAETARCTPINGGFSGAGIWRVEVGGRNWCLRRWPREALPVPRLRELHRWLGRMRDAGVPVPVPAPGSAGETSLCVAGRWWQLEPWLSGSADFHVQPTAARLTSAMQMLARLHLASEAYDCTAAGAEWFTRGRGSSPAVVERLRILVKWSPAAFAAARQRVNLVPNAPLREAARELAELAQSLTTSVPQQLLSVAADEVTLAPRLRDIWHDHVLFGGDAVTGLIDPAATRSESVAADLARLLMSLIGSDGPRWIQALAAYEAVRPFSITERRLVPVLGISGAVLSGLHWVERTAAGDPRCDDPQVPPRMREIVGQLRGIEALAPLIV